MNKSIREILHPSLVAAILRRMRAKGREPTFLDWNADSAVGDSCRHLNTHAVKFVNKLRDVTEDDRDNVWYFAAVQCCVYAYS